MSRPNWLRGELLISLASLFLSAAAVVFAHRATVASEAQTLAAQESARLEARQDRAAEEGELAAARDALTATPFSGPAWADLNSFAQSHEDRLRSLLDQTSAQFLAPAAAELGLALGRSLKIDDAASRTCDAKIETLARIARLAKSERFTRDTLRSVLADPLRNFAADEYFRCVLLLEPKAGNRALYLAAFFWGASPKGSYFGADPERAVTRGPLASIRELAAMVGVTIPTHRTPPESPTQEQVAQGAFQMSGCGGGIRDIEILGDPTTNAVTGFSVIFTPLWTDSPGEDAPCFEWVPKGVRGRLALRFTRSGDTVLSVNMPGIGPMQATVPARAGRYVRGKGVTIQAWWDFFSLIPSRTLGVSVNRVSATATIPLDPLFVDPRRTD